MSVPFGFVIPHLLSSTPLLPLLLSGDEDGEAIEMAFSKKKIEERKAWLTAFEPGTFLDMAENDLSYQDFVNKVRLE